MAVNLALSVILGGSLLILFAFFIIQNLSHRHDVDRQLEDLSDHIRCNFTDEISQIIKQLYAYDSIYADKSIFNYVNSSNEYKTRVRKDILSMGKGSAYFPGHYEFGDYYFWVDNTTGYQAAYLTPFRPTR